MDTARLSRLAPTDPAAAAELRRAHRRAGIVPAPDPDRAEVVRESCLEALSRALGRTVSEETLHGLASSWAGLDDALPEGISDAERIAASVALAILAYGEDHPEAWRRAAGMPRDGEARDVASLVGELAARLGHSCGGCWGVGLSAAEMVAAQASRAWLRDHDRHFGGIPCWGAATTVGLDWSRRRDRIVWHPVVAGDAPWHGSVSHPEPGRAVLHHVTGTGRAAITAWSSVGDTAPLDVLRVDIEAGPTYDEPRGRWAVSVTWWPQDGVVEVDRPDEDLLSDRPDRAEILEILDSCSDGALVADLRAAGYSWLPDAIESLEAWWAPADEPEGEP